MIVQNKKISLINLGCPRNLVDSENILGRLNDKGYSVAEIGEADTAIVNTCAFIQDALAESIEMILDLVKLKKEGRLKRIIVYGCLVQRYKDKLKKELPEVDAFIGKVSLNHVRTRFPITPSYYAYLKICEGCFNSCSFCVIPKIKGKLTSLDSNTLLKKAEAFDRAKTLELNIIGQDITSYGIDLYGKRSLPELVKNILKKTKHINWIRLLYLYPDLKIIDALLDIVKDDPRVCKYIDLPIQHINNRILKLMGRKSTKADILKIIERIRKKVPQAAIRTSLIVGFPSETDDEFKELYEFIQQVKFERLGVFSYSREEATPAYSFKQQLPAVIKKERFNKIMLRQQEISQKNNERMLGQIIDVLIEEKEGLESGNCYLGRSQYDAPEVDGLVYVNASKELSPGDFVKVKITDTMEYDLVGELIK